MNQVPFAYYLDQARTNNDVIARMVLKNGGTVSIQAGPYHYCTPQSALNSYRFYSEFEMGYPKGCVITDELKYYAEDPEDYSGTVYGRVPISVINQFLEANGGVVGYQSTRMKVIEIQADQVDIAQWIIETS